MRRRIISMVFAVALGLGAINLTTLPAQAAGTVVPDAAFAACLNGYLGQAATAPITAAQLQGLAPKSPFIGVTSPYRIIDCGGKGISSIEGAQYLTNSNLTSLVLGGNKISDLSPLANLTTLADLSLVGNQIRDVAPLAGLVGLATLNLDSNQLSDVSPLAKLPFNSRGAEYHLTLSNNRIADISTLNQLLTRAIAAASTSFIIAENQQVSLPSVAVGTYPLPINRGVLASYGYEAPGETRFTLNTKSPAMAMSVNVTAGTITYGAAGTYMVDWISSLDNGTAYSGTFTITVTDPSGTPMYRLYNPVTGEHFYTASVYEATVNVASGAWNSEGIGWYASPTKTGAPVYRLGAKPGTGSAGHVFTTSLVEKTVAMASGQWNDEGIGWYSSGNISIYRQYKPTTGQHNYTSDANEIRVITTQQGWVVELNGTAAWLGLAPGNPANQAIAYSVKNYKG